MPGAKTIQKEGSVTDYLKALKDPKRQQDCMKLVRWLEEKTRLEPKLWGTSIVGFGSYHYQYASGHSGDAPLVGLSSRASAITLYLSADFDNKEVLLNELGKYKAGKGCLYIQKLEDIRLETLLKLVEESILFLQKAHHIPDRNR